MLFHDPFGPKLRALKIPLWGFTSLFSFLFISCPALLFYIFGLSFFFLLLEVRFIFAVVPLFEANTEAKMALLFLGIKNVETALVTVSPLQLCEPNSIELITSAKLLKESSRTGPQFLLLPDGWNSQGFADFGSSFFIFAISLQPTT